MQITEIERVLDELEAAAHAAEAKGAARPLPWRQFLGDDVDAGAFVALTPQATLRLVAVARAALGAPSAPAEKARLFPWRKADLAPAGADGT